MAQKEIDSIKKKIGEILQTSLSKCGRAQHFCSKAGGGGSGFQLLGSTCMSSACMLQCSIFGGSGIKF